MEATRRYISDVDQTADREGKDVPAGGEYCLPSGRLSARPPHELTPIREGRHRNGSCSVYPIGILPALTHSKWMEEVWFLASSWAPWRLPVRSPRRSLPVRSARPTQPLAVSTRRWAVAF